MVEERYGIPAVDLSWDRGGTANRHPPRRPHRDGPPGGGRRCVDACRIARWTRHALAVVPGMGTFESTMQVRPWQTPWSLFALAVSARAFGSAWPSQRRRQPAPDPLTRVLLRQALRMASHRSVP